MTNMYNLVDENDPLLRKTLPSITLFDETLVGVAEKMKETRLSHEGLGLAAPQVGLALCMFIMRIQGDIIACVNPDIISSENEIVCEESCLSFPNLTLKVKRADRITGSFLTIKGEPVTTIFEGVNARCFQHELDHLNGITFDKKVSKLVLTMAKKKRQKQRSI